MKNSRRTFFKQGLAGALALGSASLPIPAAAMTDGVGKAKAKRVVLISLDGICVEGFLKARTPNLDALLADGSLSLDRSEEHTSESSHSTSSRMPSSA